VTKKNYRKVPHNLINSIAALAVDDVVVATVKRLTLAEISNYAHLGLALNGGDLIVPSPAVPSPKVGKYSSANVYGKPIVRRDLPKESRSYIVEAPNWNGSGTHDVWLTREVYPRDLIPPKEVALSVEVLSQDTSDSSYMVKFAIEQVLRRTAPDFERELLYNLNILQENLGAVGVFASAASLDDYLNTVHVDWEILPAGTLTVDEVLTRMLQNKRPVSVEQRRQMQERLAVLQQLRPKDYIAGTSEFLRYFGARFSDSLVAFENLTYGNALYVMYENWQTLSQRSRVDLLKGPREGFDRIPHAYGWDQQLERLLDRRLPVRN
jgi:hypothetical protein